MNLYLIGYMGSGKSSVGKRMANRLDMQFVDLDVRIEEYANATIQEIFDRSGEASFRELEAHILERTMGETGLVVATGGGTPCHSGNIEKLMDNGLVVYLELTVDKIYKRVTQGKQNRPLINAQKDGNLKAYISEHLDSRLDYYTQAHMVVDADKINAKALDEIKETFLEYSK